MLSPDAPVQTEAHPEPANAAATIARLQRLLTDAIAQRAALTESNAILFAESKHWYVEDGTGYCEACNLPRKNRRHSPRVAA